MSDDHNHRPHRTSESIARTGQGRGTPSGNDTLAELARLIGQTDPFGDAVHATSRLAESAGAPPAVDWTAPATQPQQTFSTHEFLFAAPAQARQPAAAYTFQPAQPSPPPSYEPARDHRAIHSEPAVPPYLTQRGPAPQVEVPPYHPAVDYGDEHHDAYDDVPSGRRRIGVLAVAALFGLAVVGTAGAFGYRAVFGGSGSHVPPVIKADTRPLKVVPKEAESKKAVTDRVAVAAEKVVPREEKPVDIEQKIVAPAAAAAPPPLAMQGNGILSSAPKKVHTVVIRPDGSEMAPALASPMPPQAPIATVANASAPATMPQPARTSVAPPAPPPRPAVVAHEAPKSVHTVAAPRPSASAPLSLNPNAEAPPRPVRTANAAPTSLATPAHEPARHASGGYAVQVSSQRSEAEAKTAYRGLQGKYGKELGSQPMFVHKVDLGAKGVYYRTMVGPFASASEATELCSSLKSAGGSCLIQKN